MTFTTQHSLDLVSSVSVSQVEAGVGHEGGQGQLQWVQRLRLRGEVDVDAVLGHLLRVQPVGLDVLLHVVALDESPVKQTVTISDIAGEMFKEDLLVAVGALVWLLPSVDLPVSVETAGVGQQLPALLALDAGLTIGTDHPRLNAA